MTERWLWLGLIDVVFQMAFCLMVVLLGMEPREGRVHLDLPVAAPAAGERTPAAAPDRVTVEVLGAGAYRHPGDERSPGGELDDAGLDALLRAAAERDAAVDIRGDRAAPYGAVFHVLDRARTLGVPSLDLACRTEDP